MPGFVSVTQISQEYGLSVDDVRAVLAGAGYLDARGPTTKAAVDGAVREKRLERSKFGNGPARMLLWDAAAVERAMLGAGATPGGGGAGVVVSPATAAERLSEAASLFWDALVRGRAGLPREVERTLGAWRFEGAKLTALLRAEDWAGAARWIEDLRAPLEEYLKPRRKLEYRDDMRLARHKMNAVLGWIEARRLPG